MAEVEFFFSIGSRYSYLAATRMAELEQAGHRVIWRPLNSRALMERRGRDPFAGDAISGQYEWRWRKQDAERWAVLYGIPFLDAQGRVEYDPGAVALAAVAGARLGQAGRYALELFDAMFVDASVQRLEREEFVRRAQRRGWSREVFERALDEAETRELHEQTLAAALDAGVFGVPTFQVEGESFWGNDRLVLLKDYLARRGGRAGEPGSGERGFGASGPGAPGPGAPGSLALGSKPLGKAP